MDLLPIDKIKTIIKARGPAGRQETMPGCARGTGGRVTKRAVITVVTGRQYNPVDVPSEADRAWVPAVRAVMTPPNLALTLLLLRR